MKKMLFLLFIGSYCKLLSQGCSDAGVCTLSAYNASGDQTDSLKNNVTANLSYGFADYSIHIFSANISYSRIWNKPLSTEFKRTTIKNMGRRLFL